MMQEYRSVSTIPRVAVCFMLSGRFETLNLWKKWLKSGEGVVGFIHTSNADSHQKQEIDQFASETNSQIVPSIPTKWGTTSLTHAECILYDAAFNHSPSIHHCWLVSEKTIPVVRLSKLLEYSESLLSELSQVIDIKDPNQHEYPEYQKLVPQLDSVKSITFGSQFKVMYRSHWMLIRKEVYDMLGFLDSQYPEFHWSEDNPMMMHPDEFIIHTYLTLHSCNLEFGQQAVWDHFEDGTKRAATLTQQNIRTLLKIPNEAAAASSSSGSRKRKASTPKHLTQLKEEIKDQEGRMIACQNEVLKGEAIILGARKVMREQQDIFELLEKYVL